MFECKLMSADEIFDKAMTSMAPLPSQESCARQLSSIFSCHLTNVALMDAGLYADELPRQHAIMVAPTGVGKTYLLRHIAAACGVNMIFMDGSSLARDGWKGATFGQQLSAAKRALGDADRFARSVLFIDECDKMRLHNHESDVGNVMDNLLQLFNGGDVTVGTDDKQTETIDVSRFTVIMGGAFDGIEEIIRDRMVPKVGIGFGVVTSGSDLDDKAIMLHVTHEDLVKYGMKRELIGRIGSIVTISHLGVEDYRILLTAEAGSVRAHYRNYLSHGYGVSFDISDKAIYHIAEQCSKAAIGARAVTPIVNQVMRRAVAEVSRDRNVNKVILSADESGCCVQYEYGERGVNSIGKYFRNCIRTHCMKADSVPALANMLMDKYFLSGCDREFAREFGLFAKITLSYLVFNCVESERTFDNLRKFARVTDKGAKGHLSRFEVIISDYLQRPGCILEMKEWFREFNQVWNRGTAQRLSRALTMIRQQLVWDYKTSAISFYVPPPPPPEKLRSTKVKTRK